MRGRPWPGGMSPRYRLFRRICVALARLLLGFTVHGEERVPGKGPLIVAANHSRFSDPVLVCIAVPRRVQWMAKKEMFAFPFRKFFGFLGAFPVDREHGGRAAVRTALGFLAQGWALGIFPEGTRRRPGAAGEAKNGAVLLAVRSGAPILPVYIGPFPSPRARLRGERLHAYVGEPVTLDNTLRGRRAYGDAAEEVLRAIYALPGVRAID